MNTLTFAIFFAGAALLGTEAFAAQSHIVQEYQFNLDDIHEVDINAGVGTIEIVHSNTDTVRVQLTLEGKRRYWILNKRDVSDIKLVDSIRDHRLRLEIDEDDTDNIKIHWHVELPSVARTRVNLGVGQITAAFVDTELALDIGVGAAEVDIARAHAYRVDLAAGVGDTKLSGADNVVSKRVMVSEQTYGFGDGHKRMELNVGVGDIEVTLSDLR